MLRPAEEVSHKREQHYKNKPLLMRHTSNEHTEQQLKQLDGAEKRKPVAVKAENELLTKFLAVVRRKQDRNQGSGCHRHGELPPRLCNLPSEVQSRVSLLVPPLRRWQ
eukprot:9018370-Pyramimonas_sp.AAC.1